MSADVIRFPAVLEQDDGRVTYGCRRWQNCEIAIEDMTPKDFDRTMQWGRQRSAWERQRNGGGQQQRGGGNAA